MLFGLSTNNFHHAQQILSVKQKKKKNSPVLKRQNQDGCNINQNQLKNTHLFHIVFEVLKVLLIKICQMQPLDILFLVVVC